MKRLNHIICALALLVLPAQANTISVDERDMKAALIYNFSVYTTWPELTGSTFNVCAFEGDDENINNNLFESKKINGKPIHFVIIHAVSEVKSCQVLYLEETNKIGDNRLFENMEKFSVLSIAQIKDKTENASIIKIQLNNNKYDFTINNQVAKQANLMVSSKLLRLATRVY
jgi:hypothetical protein